MLELWHRRQFQFLSRNSVRWDQNRARWSRARPSQFQFLSRNSVRWDNIIGTQQGHNGMFQFLSRNSVRWDLLWCSMKAGYILSFNSSVGILSVGTGPEPGR